MNDIENEIVNAISGCRLSSVYFYEEVYTLVRFRFFSDDTTYHDILLYKKPYRLEYSGPSKSLLIEDNFAVNFNLILILIESLMENRDKILFLTKDDLIKHNELITNLKLMII